VDPEQFSKLSLWQIVKLLRPSAWVLIVTCAAGLFAAGVGYGRGTPPAHDQAVAAAHSPLRETAIGAANGRNRAFMMQRTPPDPAQVKVWLGELLMDRDKYAISGRMVTFREDTIPVEGESVDVEY